MDEVPKCAASLVQSTISLTLRKQQAKNKKSEMVIVTGEMPQQFGVGLAIHQAFCSKEIIKMFHGFGFSVEYKRLLRVQVQIQWSIIQRTKCSSPLTTFTSQKTLIMVERLSMGHLFIRRPSLITPNWKSD